MTTSRHKTGGANTRSRLETRSLQPHILIFLLLLLLYLVPLVLASSFSYEKGGILSIVDDAHLVMGKIVLVYFCGFFAFCLGSWSVPKVCWMLGATWSKSPSVARISHHRSDSYLLALTVSAFLVAKLLLVREGVYSNYAFDTGGMDSSVWTASMFLSEAVSLASIIVLFSSSSKNVRHFLFLSLLNGVNLLHGTRNFFVVAILAFAVYAYVRTTASLIKMALYGIGVFLGAAGLAYAVFLMRSHVADAGFALLDILSPITLESVFSQMPLISLLNHPILISPFGSPYHLLQDVTVFTLPRILVENKETSIWLGQFSYLSPLGAFNGFAAGILYFGYMYPLFYYFVGFVAGGLYRFSRNEFGAIIYLYFTCNFLYRIVRDGYIIPFKMLINVLELVLLLALSRYAQDAIGKYKPRRPLADNEILT